MFLYLIEAKMSINYDELISDLKNCVLSTTRSLPMLILVYHTLKNHRLPSGTPGRAVVKETAKQDINIVITEYF